ncbi:uncharacterized protein K452DRAFT_336570, partial [Aplosporella prunicola CBS 121167]
MASTSTPPQPSKPDHWSSKAYTTAAPFVPALTSALLAHLTPHLTPTSRILDLGAGDGPLSARLAALVPHGRVLGLDSSPAMIAAAGQTHAHTNCSFRVADCARLRTEAPDLLNGTWDTVFSNAALHWILRAPASRDTVFADVHAALKPGGVFVAELGGKGNVAEVHAALVAALLHCGVSGERARAACPWFFPTEAWVRDMLGKAGFVVEVVETEFRPTRLTAEGGDGDGTGGLDGWVRLMGKQFLEEVDEGRREEV